jgi:RNA polymerase sigma-70 factor (ECF subfamily)
MTFVTGRGRRPSSPTGDIGIYRSARHLRTLRDMTNTLTVELAPELDRHRAELTRHCSRLLGSCTDAEDAVQETMVRAWRAYGRFEGRSSVRTWLYHIATNVCRDSLDRSRRRPLPIDLTTPWVVANPPDVAGWRTPTPPSDDPCDRATTRDAAHTALVAAVRVLPARQRAVLVLREVLQWRAVEVADLLDTSVAAVNSALQRARAALAGLDPGRLPRATSDAREDALVARYADAFARVDVSRLVALLRVEAGVAPRD